MQFKTPRTHLKGHNFPIRIPFRVYLFSWLQNQMENTLQGEFCENKGLEKKLKNICAKNNSSGPFQRPPCDVLTVLAA